MMMMMMMACDGYNQQQSLNYAPLISVVVQQSSCQVRGGGGMKSLSSPHSSLCSSCHPRLVWMAWKQTPYLQLDDIFLKRGTTWRLFIASVALQQNAEEETRFRAAQRCDLLGRLYWMSAEDIPPKIFNQSQICGRKHPSVVQTYAWSCGAAITAHNNSQSSCT